MRNLTHAFAPQLFKVTKACMFRSRAFRFPPGGLPEGDEECEKCIQRRDQTPTTFSSWRGVLHIMRLCLCLMVCLLLSAAVAAQPQVSPKPDTTDPKDPAGAQQTAAAAQEAQPSGTSNDRLFWALPDFLTVQNAGHISPLTPGQKFKVVVRGTFDPVEGVFLAFVAGLNQVSHSDPSYGQGAAGYGKRYGTAFGDNGIENFMTSAILPTLLKQDPRYFQLGSGSFFHRTGYAISRIFVTRTDSGGTQFNISEIAGSAASAAIGTYTYHPSENRTLMNVITVWGTQVGWDTVTNGVKEFWPDIRRRLTKKRPPPSAATHADNLANTLRKQSCIPASTL